MNRVPLDRWVEYGVHNNLRKQDKDLGDSWSFAWSILARHGQIANVIHRAILKWARRFR